MSLVIRMIGNAWKTSKNIALAVLLVVSLFWNATTVSLGGLSTVIAAVFETITGAKTVASQLLTKKEEAAALRVELAVAKKAASKAEGTAIGRGLVIAQEKAANQVLKAEIKTAAQRASKFEGKSLGLALVVEQEKKAKAALRAELAALRVGRKVMVDGAELSLDDAVLKAATRVKGRMAKLATTDLSATFGQALPWIGASVVVAATAYDLNASCETMKDMHFIEVALNPLPDDTEEIDRVCGLRVPTEKEIWDAIKASPGAAWDGAKSVLTSLSTLPDMPEFDWPSLP